MNNQFMINFTSLTIQSCFSRFYVVPDYQREYVWDRQQVEQLMADLEEAFESDPEKEYFLGSIVTYKKDHCFELIDGQQRLTTFFLILCALKRIFEKNGESSSIFDNLIRSEDFIIKDGIVVKETQYHLQLQYEEASNYLELIHKGEPRPEQLTASGIRLFDAVQIIESYIEEKIPDFSDQGRFAAFLLKQTRFIQIETYDVTGALKVFETINQRGVGLNPMDLLKNMIFRQVKREKFAELNQNWKEITRALERINEKPLRFLRYFIISNYDVKGGVLREDQIYDWLSKNNSQCQYEEKPFSFVQKMKQNVDRYCEYLQAKGEDDGSIHLSNIALLAGRSYKLHLVLLLASTQMEPQTLARFKRLLESVVYYAIINRITTNNTERIFAAWCPEVRKIRTDSDLDSFVSEYVIPYVNQWKTNHEQVFLRLGLKSMQQYRIKFLLAKITAYVDAQRSGKNETGPLGGYINSSMEIEHIMPQTCKEVEAFGMALEDYEIYINRLGNLTLLENSINSSIHNKNYSEKCEEYKKSKFYLTISIPELVEQGTNTAINRTNKKLHAWEKWNKTSIEERQKMLYDLSEEIWSIDGILHQS